MPTPQPLSRSRRERFTRALAQHFFLRFHVSLIIGFTFCAGFAVSKTLFALGLISMPLRYAFALAGAYLAFLLACRLWIFYVSLFEGTGGSGPSARLRGNGSRGISLTDLDVGSGGGASAGGRSGGGLSIRGGGGGFSGAGASGEFDASGNAPAIAAFSGSDASAGGARSGGTSSGAGGGKGSGFSLDLGDDGLALIFLIAVIAAIFGTVAYIFYAGPTILADSAFEALVAGGFVRHARMLDSDWLGSLVKATWIPLVALLITLVGFGYFAQQAYPDTHTAREIVGKLYERWLN